MTMAPFPPGAPFPQSTTQTVPGAGPDFPGSSGDREQGKFRPSATPRLDAVAVVNDDGSPVGASVLTYQDESLLYQRAMVIGLQMILQELNADMDVDLIELAQMAVDE